MTPDRLDELLERVLDSGAIPADATPEERAQLEPLLARARDLRLEAARVGSEADAALPTARARFQRHLEAQRPAARAAASPLRSPQRGLFGRFFTGGAMTLASSAVALGVVAVLAILILQPFSSPETASALTVDDYVQVQGVVLAAGDGTVTVQSPDLGSLEVALSDVTAVGDENGSREAASLRAGDPVIVTGVVTDRRAIAASNVAVAQNQGSPTPVAERKIPLLKSHREGLEGRLTVISLSPDGRRARVLLVHGDERVLVDVDPRAMDQFLAETPEALGSTVRVVQGAGLPAGVFRLEAAAPPEGSPSPQPERPRFQDIRGVIVGRTLNVLMVRTDRGTVPVVLRPLTSIRFGDSGLTPEDIRAGEGVIGYEVAITGNLEDATGRRIIASIVVVTGKAPQRPAGQ